MWMGQHAADALSRQLERQAEAITTALHSHEDGVHADTHEREAWYRAELAAVRDEAGASLEAGLTQERMLNQLLDEAKRDAARERQRADLLWQQLSVTQNNFEWARVRLNAMELERATLMERLFDVRLPVPELARMPLASVGIPVTRERPFEESESSDLLAAAGLPGNIFEDMGDSEARTAGLLHLDDGTVDEVRA
jgi:hypothetical protein